MLKYQKTLWLISVVMRGLMYMHRGLFSASLKARWLTRTAYLLTRPIMRVYWLLFKAHTFFWLKQVEQTKYFPRAS